MKEKIQMRVFSNDQKLKRSPILLCSIVISAHTFPSQFRSTLPQTGKENLKPLQLSSFFSFSPIFGLLWEVWHSKYKEQSFARFAYLTGVFVADEPSLRRSSRLDLRNIWRNGEAINFNWGLYWSQTFWKWTDYSHEYLSLSLSLIIKPTNLVARFHDKPPESCGTDSPMSLALRCLCSIHPLKHMSWVRLDYPDTEEI